MPKLPKADRQTAGSSDDRNASTSPRDEVRPSPFVLWPGHQSILWIAGVFALLAVSIYFGWMAYQGHGLVDIDDAPPLTFEFLVDLNEADWPELAAIPGIGKTLAQRIVAHRTQNGPFKNIETLTDVSGIGPKSLERFRPFLVCGSPTKADSASALMPQTAGASERFQ